jgi:hypothetical protein
MKTTYTYRAMTIQYGEPDEGDQQASFGPDDFETWFLAGADRNDRFGDSDRGQLFENCIYLTNAEDRVLIQTPDELRDAIGRWADEWNARADSRPDEA